MDEAATMLADIGYRKPVTKLTVTDTEALKSALVDHHCMLKVKAYIDQFIEGLEVLGIMTVVRKYPGLMKELFVFDKQKSIMTPGMCEVVYIHAIQ